MKNFLFFIIIIVINSSCSQNNLNVNQSHKEPDNIVNIDTTGNEKIEKKLKVQLNEYLIAFNGGDPDKAISYCYPDMFVYMKQQYPADYSIEAIKETLKDPVKELKKTATENNLTYEFKIGKITKRFTIGHDKIYLIVTSVVVKKGFNEVSTGAEIVAISNNDGINWTFVGKDSISTPPILRMKFSEDIVNRLMDKK